MLKSALLLLISFILSVDCLASEQNLNKDKDKSSKLSKFNTKDHPKALGYEIEITYPSSWEKSEGNRPHIVQKFSNPNSEITTTCLLLIKKLDYTFTKEEEEKLVDIIKPEDIVPKGSELISTKKTLYDNHPGLYYLTYMKSEMATVKLHNITENNVFFYKNIGIQIQCSVASLQSSTTKEQLIQKYFQEKPNFLLISSSIITLDQYNDVD